MTVINTILSFPGLSDFPTRYLEQILGGRSIDGMADPDSVGESLVNLAIADCLLFAVNLPDFTENKLSLKYPREYFLKTAKLLYIENGEPEKVASFRRVNVRAGRATKRW